MTAPVRRAGGIYALADLGGAPLDPGDLTAMDLVASKGQRIAVAAVDEITPAAVRVIVEAGRTTAFLGWLDEPEAVADRLQLPRITDHAILARAALDRFGDTTPAALLGGWAMLDHQPQRNSLVMLAGFGRCAPLLYAHLGDRLVVAPTIHRLSRIGWIGRTLDEDALLQSLTICTPDGERQVRTILRGVRRVPRGGCVTITAAGAPQVRVSESFIAVPRWTGDQNEAIAAAEELLHRVVEQRLRRSPSPALLLSGGLDSSLIAWTLRAAGASSLPALTSAVARGRGVADETGYAAVVAATLGMPLHQVVPPADVNVYRPSAETMAASNVPPLSPRDYLYAAFADAAASLGATELFDGPHGELTFTAYATVSPWHSWPRDLARTARDRWRGWRRPAVEVTDGILDVILAKHRLAQSQPTLCELAALLPDGRDTHTEGGLWGYAAGARPPLRRDVAEARAGRLRFVRPYHDIRLLRLFAGFPASFKVGEGMSRWPARAILRGRLPEQIVRRRTTMPFSPDYDLRLVEQAPAALARVKSWRAADCDEWFDLDALEAGLRRMAAGRLRDGEATLRLQLTAQACEFLLWWRTGAVG